MPGTTTTFELLLARREPTDPGDALMLGGLFVTLGFVGVVYHVAMRHDPTSWRWGKRGRGGPMSRRSAAQFSAVFLVVGLWIAAPGFGWTGPSRDLFWIFLLAVLTLSLIVSAVRDQRRP